MSSGTAMSSGKAIVGAVAHQQLSVLERAHRNGGYEELIGWQLGLNPELKVITPRAKPTTANVRCAT